MINHPSAHRETQPDHNEKRPARCDMSKSNKKRDAVYPNIGAASKRPSVMPLPLFFGLLIVIIGTMFLFASLGAYTHAHKLSVETAELVEQLEQAKQNNDIDPSLLRDEEWEIRKFSSAVKEERSRALTYAVLGLLLIASGVLLSQWKAR